MLLSTHFVYQTISVYISLAISAIFFLLSLSAYIWKPEKLNQILKWGIGIILVWYLVKAGYSTWIQYTTWQHDPISKFLLPPHAPIGYFSHYAWTHFFWGLVWVFGGAGILGGVVLVLRMLSKGRMVDKVDIKLAIFGGLVVGWPQMIIFFSITLFLTLITALIYGIITKQEKFISFTPFFFVGILIVFFWGNDLVVKLGLSRLIV